jgi:hypothetical protein
MEAIIDDYRFSASGISFFAMVHFDSVPSSSARGFGGQSFVYAEKIFPKTLLFWRVACTA